MKALNEQQVENERLHQRVSEANAALVEANKASQVQLVQLVDEEKEKAAEERQQLLAQVASLINASADAQEKRLSKKVSVVCDTIDVTNGSFETEQAAYTEGMGNWTSKSREILAGVSISRENVKAKLKGDFAVSALHQLFTVLY